MSIEESQAVERLLFHGNDKNDVSAGTGAIVGWTLSGSRDGIVQYSVSLRPYESDQTLTTLISDLKASGAISVIELGVDDLWPGCSPPECTITVWDTVGPRY